MSEFALQPGHSARPLLPQSIAMPYSAAAISDRRQLLACSPPAYISFFSSWEGRTGGHQRRERGGGQDCTLRHTATPQNVLQPGALQAPPPGCEGRPQLPSACALLLSPPPCLHLDVGAMRGSLCGLCGRSRFVGGGSGGGRAGACFRGHLSPHRGLAVGTPRLGGGDLCTAAERGGFMVRAACSKPWVVRQAQFVVCSCRSGRMVACPSPLPHPPPHPTPTPPERSVSSCRRASASRRRTASR